MKVIPPIKVTSEVLISTNAPENDAPEWDNLTTYADRDRVILSAKKMVYESVQGSNLGNAPDEVASTFWVPVMATNPWRAFDGVLSAPVTKTGGIQYTLAPEVLIRAVGVIGVKASHVAVRVINPEDEVVIFQRQSVVDFTDIIDPLSMVTVEPGTRETVIFEDILCQPGNTIQINIGEGTGDVSVSEIIVGDAIDLGTAVFGSGIGIDDFSQFQEDQFGNVQIVQRGYRDTTRFIVSMNTGSTRRIRRSLAKIRAQFALYYFTADEQDYGTTVLGKYDSLEMLLSGPNVSDMELKVRGATYDGD